MKNCIFCDQDYSDGKRAKEHIFSKDLLREFSLLKENLAHSAFRSVKGDFSGGHITISPTTRSLTYSGFVAGQVCASCNNEWMNKLEEAVRPFLYLLMRGETSVESLSEDQKYTLACWFLKTSIALSQSVGAPQYLVPRDHAKRLYENQGKVIPDGMAVFSFSSRSSDFLWSLCTTWTVEVSPTIAKEQVAEEHEGSYKIFVQLGRLMLLACYWPHENLVYTYEGWGVVPIGGQHLCEVVPRDCRNNFSQESEQLIMALGVYLESEDA